MCLAATPGSTNIQRHADQRLPQLEPVSPLAVLAERLAVVGAEDDGRARAPRLAAHELEKLADVAIGEGDLAVVQIARLLAEGLDVGVPLVLIVRIEEVKPREESPRRVGRIAEHSLGDLLGSGLVMFSSVVAFHLRPGHELVDVEPSIEAGRIFAKVEVRVRGDRPDAGGLQPLGEHQIVAVFAEEISVALHLAGVPSAEQAAEAHRGVRRERVRVRVGHRSLLERGQIRRDGALVSGPRHVGAKRIDGDQEDVQISGRARGDGGLGDRASLAVCMRGAFRGGRRARSRFGGRRLRASTGQERCEKRHSDVSRPDHDRVCTTPTSRVGRKSTSSAASLESLERVGRSRRSRHDLHHSPATVRAARLHTLPRSR